MGRILIFLGILGIIGGVLIGVVGPFMGGFGFGGFNDFLNTATNGEATAAELCREGETLETDQGASTFTQGQGWARSTQYYCVNNDGVRRDVTGEFVEGLFGGVFNMLPGFLGGIGISALLSTCGTGLLVVGIILAVMRGRRGMQVVTTQSYVSGADLNSILAQARNTPVVTGSSPKASGGDLTARLEQLKAAFDKKLISQEEYDRARKAILDEMR